MSVIYHVFDFVTWTAVSVSKIYITCLKLSVLHPFHPHFFTTWDFFWPRVLGVLVTRVYIHTYPR